MQDLVIIQHNKNIFCRMNISDQKNYNNNPNIYIFWEVVVASTIKASKV